MTTSIKIGIAGETANQRSKAAELARHLSLPLVDTNNRQYRLLLVFTDRHLELRDTAKNAPGPIFVDFCGGKNDYRRRQSGGLQQTLARAIGIKANASLTVIDATAGLGRDSFVMATLGCRVIMYERNPITHALLADGLRRATIQPDTSAIIERMHLVCGSLSATSEQAEVIYLDPMYPHRTKSALVKKEMRFLRTLSGDDMDAPALLQLALQITGKQVVVKRPKTAPPLSQHLPERSISSKNTRYDIYLAENR